MIFHYALLYGPTNEEEAIFVPYHFLVFVYLIDSLHPINNLSIKQGQAFLG